MVQSSVLIKIYPVKDSMRGVNQFIGSQLSRNFKIEMEYNGTTIVNIANLVKFQLVQI